MAARAPSPSDLPRLGGTATCFAGTGFPLGGARWHGARAQCQHLLISSWAAYRVAASASLPQQLSKIPLLEGWDFTATGHEMAPLLQSVPLSGLISVCKRTGLSVRSLHISPPKLTRKYALHRAQGSRAPRFSCALGPGALARAPDVVSPGGLNCFGVGGQSRPQQENIVS